MNRNGLGPIVEFSPLIYVGSQMVDVFLLFYPLLVKIILLPIVGVFAADLFLDSSLGRF